MAGKVKSKVIIKVDRFHFSVKLKSIFFPVDLPELTPLLSEIGYSVRKELTDKIPDISAGLRLSVSGNIAENKDNGQIFRIDPERGVLARGRKAYDHADMCRICSKRALTLPYLLSARQ
jgi:hypothetical protein